MQKIFMTTKNYQQCLKGEYKMKIIKKASVLLILVLISFLFVHCAKKDDGISDFTTHSNAYYTIQYPSNWLEPEGDDAYLSLSNEDNQFSLHVTTRRIYPYTDNYLEENIKKSQKDFDIEECIIGGNRGYKIKLEVNDEINTAYIVQEKDLFLEMNFVCQADNYDYYKSLINQITKTFEFNDFEIAEYSSKYVSGDRDTKWLADIEFLSEQLPKKHKNLFFKVEKEDFLSNVRSIKEKIPSLTDDEMIVEVSKLLASVGDAHTSFLFDTKGKYPFVYYYFNDGIYIIDSLPEYSEFIGYKLIGVNEKSIEEIRKLFLPIISHENEVWFKHKFARYLVFPEFLNGLNITDSETAKFILIDKNGNKKSVEVKATPFKNSDLVNRNIDKSERMLYLKNSDKNYWYEFLEDDKLLYFQYNVCYNMKGKSFLDFNKELFEFIDNNTINKLVIDLRNNVGGSTPVLDPFFVELKKRESLDHPHKLFVIVGRRTFSSAIANTLNFENETNATFIGEPTGAKPNHYGEVQFLELSNTNTKVSYSTKYIKISNEDLDSFVPDIIVEPNPDDYFNNIDSVMQRILEVN